MSADDGSHRDAFEVVPTESGALAMRCRTTSEIMHPEVGPAIEAAQLYVEPSHLRARLLERGTEPVTVLDVGLGAGSNALAAWRVAEALAPPARRLELVSFDRTLDPLRLAASPAHAAAFGIDEAAQEAIAALCALGRHESARCDWRLQLGDLLPALAREPAHAAHIVFWDPFSPRASPALWSIGAFVALRRLCREGATVHTYSRAPATRVALLLAGFYVGLGPPSGRKHKPTTLAATALRSLAQPLDGTWLARLATSRLPLPCDAPPDALAQLARHAQFAAAPSEAGAERPIA